MVQSADLRNGNDPRSLLRRMMDGTGIGGVLAHFCAAKI